MHEIQPKLSIVFNYLKYWFTNNGLSLNLKETIYQKNTPFQLSYKDELLQDGTDIRFMGLEMDKFMNWKTRVKLLLYRLGNECIAIKNVKYCSNIETLRMICHAYFHSIMKYGIIFWHNSSDAKKFSLNKA
jgi:hypothetical protein